MAADVARRKRRLILACVLALALVAAAAAIAYRRAVDPMNAQASFDAGQRLLQVDRYNEAILSFDRTIALKPDSAEAYLLRGKALFAGAQNRANQRNADRAVSDFTKAIGLMPNDPRPLLERCAAYLDQEDLRNAVDDCSEVVRLDPQIAKAYSLRGAAKRKSGDLRGALADFTRSVDLAPTGDNYYQRAVIYESLGQHRLALADLDRMTEALPNSPLAYFARSECRLALGDVSGAKSDNRHAREIETR
jgi:tetratricopeptide (TPR) repeat protein